MNDASVQENQSLESLIARLADEFVERQTRGEQPDIEEYAALHPGHAEVIRPVLASMAQSETEVRSERQRAGIEAAREAHGGKCPWGGRPAGPNESTRPKIATVRQLKAEGRSIMEISRIVGLTRQTTYRILDNREAEK
jgi:DNA invertase Pin-like site-specific DNA recombinase